jgi:hypothetical protein
VDFTFFRIQGLIFALRVTRSLMPDRIAHAFSKKVKQSGNISSRQIIQAE